MDGMIHIENLTKRFGAVTAVDGLNLSIGAGEFYVILGPNGAGKTTAIKMIAGLYRPSSGTIHINSFDVQRQPIEAKMSIGYIPDQAFLYEKLSGREYLHFSAGLYKMEHGRTQQQVDELARQFEFDAWIDRRVEHYSQGMRQRIAIAAGLLHSPKVLIIDEPMVGLDPKSAHVVKNVLRQQSKQGVAIFMSTHSLPVAEELGDRIGIIKDGKLVFEDRREDRHSFKEKYNGRLESLFLELTK